MDRRSTGLGLAGELAPQDGSQAFGRETGAANGASEPVWSVECGVWSGTRRCGGEVQGRSVWRVETVAPRESVTAR